MRVLAESRLTSKEQLTLPLAIRSLLGVKAGDSLVWSLDDQGHVVVEAGHLHTVEHVRTAVAAASGSMPRLEPVTVRGMKTGIHAAMRRKHASR